MFHVWAGRMTWWLMWYDFMGLQKLAFAFGCWCSKENLGTVWPMLLWAPLWVVLEGSHWCVCVCACKCLTLDVLHSLGILWLFMHQGMHQWHDAMMCPGNELGHNSVFFFKAIKIIDNCQAINDVKVYASLLVDGAFSELLQFSCRWKPVSIHVVCNSVAKCLVLLPFDILGSFLMSGLFRSQVFVAISSLFDVIHIMWALVFQAEWLWRAECVIMLAYVDVIHVCATFLCEHVRANWFANIGLARLWFISM